MNVVYTKEAIADLKRLREFISAQNPTAAKRIATELIAKIELLPEFPHIGTQVQSVPAPDSIRDIVFGKYIIRYSIHTNIIIILKLWHTLEER